MLPSDYQGSFRVNARSNNRVISGSLLVHEAWPAPGGHDAKGPAHLAVANGYSVAHVGQAAAGTKNMVLGGSKTVGGIGEPNYSRNVVITVTHGAAVIAMSGIISGTDAGGKPLQEAWAVTAGGVTKTFTGKKAFTTVSSISETIAADASTNTIIAGTGVTLGLAARLSVPSAVKELIDGALVTTGTLVAASAVATDDLLGTFTPATAPDGAHVYSVYYISDDPWNS